MPVPRKRSPRQKAAAFAVVDGGMAGSRRPDPPHELTPTQADIWRQIVSSEPVDFFSSHTTREMLKDLCCHRDTSDRLNKTINQFRDEWMRSSDGMKMLKQYLKARGDETRHFSLIATRLRLTNQSRYTPKAAATASRNSAAVRPWEQQ